MDFIIEAILMSFIALFVILPVNLIVYGYVYLPAVIFTALAFGFVIRFIIHSFNGDSENE